jgi:hypothetical protein
MGVEAFFTTTGSGIREMGSTPSPNGLAQLYSRDVFASVFFRNYVINDFVFILFFAWVFLFHCLTQ